MPESEQLKEQRQKLKHKTKKMTEKNYNPEQKTVKAMKKQSKKIIEVKSAEIPKKEEKTDSLAERPIAEKKETKKEVPKIKKTEAVVNSFNLPVSTKDAASICRFIRHKKIKDAINNLEQVKLGKKAVPMRGELPHRKGMMSGRFPKEAAKHFIILLKSLAANAGEFDEPVITEAIANMGSRPYGRFGRTRKKRTHVKIIAKEKTKKEEKK